MVLSLFYSYIDFQIDAYQSKLIFLYIVFSVLWSDIQFNQGQLDELAFMFPIIWWTKDKNEYHTVNCSKSRKLFYVLCCSACVFDIYQSDLKWPFSLVCGPTGKLRLQPNLSEEMVLMW